MWLLPFAAAAAPDVLVISLVVIHSGMEDLSTVSDYQMAGPGAHEDSASNPAAPTVILLSGEGSTICVSPTVQSTSAPSSVVATIVAGLRGHISTTGSDDPFVSSLTTLDIASPPVSSSCPPRSFSRLEMRIPRPATDPQPLYTPTSPSGVLATTDADTVQLMWRSYGEAAGRGPGTPDIVRAVDRSECR
jgi:hypothetical protein